MTVMQTVTAQLQSGVLVCPQSGQALTVDGAGLRLVTPDQRYSYPFLNGTVPVLLADEEAMRGYAGDSPQMTREYTESAPARRSLLLRLLRCLVYRGKEPQVRDYRTQASIDACRTVTEDQPANAVCLSIGGGPGRTEGFTNVNIGPFPHVDVIADAHKLPYADGRVHAIYCEAVIEHLYAPHEAVQEMLRVLEPGGLVFAATPFLCPYHGYPHHYQNYTLQGHANLFRRAGFHAIEAGTCVGPIHALVLAFAMFLAQYCSSPFGRFISRAWNFSSQYLYPLDRRLNTLPNAHILAATTYVLAQKPELSCPEYLDKTQLL